MIRGNYGISDHGNFQVIDSIGVPHPFCITPKHVAFAADHCGGMLDERACAAAPCGICKKPFDAHETALLVACYAPMQEEGSKAACPELHRYLLAIKDEATRNRYAGFAFLDRIAKAQDVNPFGELEVMP